MTAFWMAPKSDWSQWMWNILPTLWQLPMLQGTFSNRKACWPLGGRDRETETRRENECYHLHLKWCRWSFLIIVCLISLAVYQLNHTSSWPITFQHGNVVVFKIWIFTLVDSLYDISDVDPGHCKLLPTTPNFLLLWAGHNSLNTAFLN